LKRAQLKSHHEDSFEGLRIRAEEALKNLQMKQDSFEGKNIEMLIQELQVHQIELEMQNDELRIVNELLQQQQMKFEGLYDLAPIGYIIMDETGIILEANNACRDLLDTKILGIINRPLEKFIADNYLNTFFKFKQQIFKTRNKQSCIVKMVSAHREFYAQIEAIIINQIVPAPQYYVAIIDVTERIEAQQSIKEIKERLELALEAASAGTWELDLATMNFYLDEFSFGICNHPGNKFDGRYQTFINLIHEGDREKVDQHFRNSINNEKEIELECRVINSSGVICYVIIRGHIIDTQDRGKRFVGIMMDITSRKKSEQETESIKAQHHANIISATLNTQESERRRISSALHDGLSQLLYGIKIKVGTLNCGGNADTLNPIYELLDMAIKEARDISFELTPAVLSAFGLNVAIKELVNRLSTRQLKIDFRAIGINDRLDTNLEITVFRIVQELINNCMKHSGADKITVEIKRNSKLFVVITDNGRGFDVRQQELSSSGAGLMSIKSRLSIYGGSLDIDSVIGQGSVAKVSIDLQGKAIRDYR
jgi:PAS domain S-box-containing protein